MDLRSKVRKGPNMPVCQIRAHLWVLQGLKWLPIRANDFVVACPPEAERAPRPAVQGRPLKSWHIRMSARRADHECAAGRVASGMSGSIRGPSGGGCIVPDPKRKSERSKPSRLGG